MNFFKKIFSEKLVSISLLNQIFVSGGNFTITILLIKYLGIKGFGEYSLILISSYFFFNLFNGFIVMPFTSNFQNKLFYINGFMQLFFLISILIFFIFLGCYFFYLNQYLSFFNLVNVYLFIIFSNFQIFNRRILFSKNLFYKSTITDITIYILIILSILILIFYKIKLSIYSILIIQFICIFIISGIVNISYKKYFIINYDNLRKILKSNKKNSINLSLSLIVSYFTNNFILLFSGLFISINLLGFYRSLTTISNVFNLIFQSFENYLPQKLSFLIRAKDYKNLKKYIVRIYKFNFIFIILLISIIYFFSNLILSKINVELLEYQDVFIFILLYSPFILIMNINNVILRAFNSSSYIFYTNVFIMLIALIFSKFLLSSFHIYGIIIFTYFQIALSICVSTFFIIKFNFLNLKNIKFLN